MLEIKDGRQSTSCHSVLHFCWTFGSRSFHGSVNALSSSSAIITDSDVLVVEERCRHPVKAYIDLNHLAGLEWRASLTLLL